jgi:hypothetical protein
MNPVSAKTKHFGRSSSKRASQDLQSNTTVNQHNRDLPVVSAEVKVHPGRRNNLAINITDSGVPPVAKKASTTVINIISPIRGMFPNKNGGVAS